MAKVKVEVILTDVEENDQVECTIEVNSDVDEDFNQDILDKHSENSSAYLLGAVLVEIIKNPDMLQEIAVQVLQNITAEEDEDVPRSEE